MKGVFFFLALFYSDLDKLTLSALSRETFIPEYVPIIAQKTHCPWTFATAPLSVSY